MTQTSGPHPDRDDSKPEPRSSPSLTDLFSLGTACAIAIVAPGALGYVLDNALGTTPWLSFAGLAFGIVSSVLLAISRMRRYM